MFWLSKPALPLHPASQTRRERKYVAAALISNRWRKKISAAFDGGLITSDGGVMLLAAAE